MARLLTEPLTRNELDDLRRRLDGELNRICVSHDAEEIAAMVMFAIDIIATMGYSRIKEIKRDVTTYDN